MFQSTPTLHRGLDRAACQFRDPSSPRRGRRLAADHLHRHDLTAIQGYSDVLMRPIALCAICLAALYVFYQLPSIASALAAGGASLTYGYGAARDAHESTLAWAASRSFQAAGRGVRAVGRTFRSRGRPAHDVLRTTRQRLFRNDQNVFVACVAAVLTGCASLTYRSPNATAIRAGRSIARCGNGRTIAISTEAFEYATNDLQHAATPYVEESREPPAFGPSHH